MIGKGAQYLTAAGFGRYRITAASLGSNLMFGSLWLKDATRQAIMDAFGVDGTAVIRATNEYLNGIAASDKAKATALAGFINEDPMMVCSLGLEPQGVTMPVRWLVSDGDCIIFTGINRDATNYYKITMYVDAIFIGNKSGWSVFGTGGRMFCGRNSNGKFAYGVGSNQETSYNCSLNTRYKMLLDCYNRTYSADGIFEISVTPTNDNSSTELGIMGWLDNSTTKQMYACQSAEVWIAISGNEVRHFVPFKTGKVWAAEDVSTGVAQAAGTCGMIDLVSGKFFPNANSSGSFTIPDISYTPTP